MAGITTNRPTLGTEQRVRRQAQSQRLISTTDGVCQPYHSALRRTIRKKERLPLANESMGTQFRVFSFSVSAKKGYKYPTTNAYRVVPVLDAWQEIRMSHHLFRKHKVDSGFTTTYTRNNSVCTLRTGQNARTHECVHLGSPTKASACVLKRPPKN